MRKILVLRGGALGDFVVTLPALAALRRQWPSATIELAGNAAAAVLARRAGLIDAAHSQHESRWAALFTAEPLASDFSAWLAAFDLVLNFWPDDEGTLARHFPQRSDQKFLNASAHPSLAPAAAHYCAALRPLGINTRDFVYMLPRPAETSPSPLVAIHPGSGSSRKNWPVAQWAALCEWLRRERGAELLIVTGEAESDAARALSRYGTAAHALALPELSDRLAGCRLFVGHDSGVSHLAAACGVPCVLLFGPTDPAMWAPPAPHVRFIRRAADVSSISIEDVKALL